MNLRQILELVNRCLALRNTELMLEFSRRCAPHTELTLLDLFLLEIIQWVRTARICPHVRKGDLLRSTLLQEELAIGRTEDECRKCSVQETLVDVFHQMAC